ncbi:hypothetical protein COCC4DRAFT_32800 [Bipolaris maydis ATCC 48331]|uniref:Uncharacterized protein n=2 Tax=Cochliobolus heterostrophus TaxID=5016 RepID=M2UG56_COCH5|nr:uncharacterized protein COCC4DRAFT_32800 [Bipolaris maydis ATCC 48331]EMD86902.1 hypothetical protein COCHEDRAFT_1023698 [Bipolaris maydis C5]ENI04101.1 hypothetical protein COCC4DRAFT_32800 [Bipolaris maydis ATCC 48331]KAJ5055598.1 hypothetical protein J3E74DRAFT_380630 [Bipolaris maydis]
MNITYLALPHSVIRPASASKKERFHTPGYGVQVPLIRPRYGSYLQHTRVDYLHPGIDYLHPAMFPAWSAFLSAPSNITRLISPTRMRRSTPWLQCRHRFFSSMGVLLGYRLNLAAFFCRHSLSMQALYGAKVQRHLASAAIIISLSICIYVKGP